MNNQKILRVCQCCYHIIEDGSDKPTGNKWDRVSPASHGMCTVCNAGSDKYGHDEWCDMTEGER